MLTDHALAKRLEKIESFIAAEYARTHARLFPELGAEAEAIAGGFAVYAEPGSPITQAVGLGMDGEVGEREVDRLEDFFNRHRSPINVEFCPHADDSLRQIFARRGYVLIEQTNTLAQPLAHLDQAARPPSVVVRPPRPDEHDKLARVVARGFVPEGDLSRMMLDLFVTFINQPSALTLLAEVDGKMAGGGVVAVVDGVASLFATSTLTEFRGRGAQTALINARLDYAIEQGCELATVGAAPGSVSLRNLERRGFRIAYTRAKLFRDLGQ